MEEVHCGSRLEFKISIDSALRFGTRLCVPNYSLIKVEISEAFTLHSVSWSSRSLLVEQHEKRNIISFYGAMPNLPTSQTRTSKALRVAISINTLYTQVEVETHLWNLCLDYWVHLRVMMLFWWWWTNPNELFSW